MNYWIFIPVIFMIVSYVELLDTIALSGKVKWKVMLWSTVLFLSTLTTMLMLSSNIVW